LIVFEISWEKEAWKSDNDFELFFEVSWKSGHLWPRKGDI